MDDQSTCWRCGEPREGDAVCGLCGAVPARARTRIRATAPADAAPPAAMADTAAVADPSAGPALLGTVAAPPPGFLPPPRPEDRVTWGGPPPPPSGSMAWPAGAGLPPPPPAPRRSLWWLRIAVPVAIAVVGLAVRVALWDLWSDADSVRRAQTPFDFEGHCVTIDGRRVQTVSCSTPHVGRVHGVVDLSSTCPANTIDSVVLRSDPTRRVCIGTG